MPREELTDLRAEVRLLIGDAVGAGATFSDDDLDRFLDANRRDFTHARISASATATGGYARFVAPPGWASNVVLHDENLVEIAEAVGDERRFTAGIFTFDPERVESTVRISGENYSRYGAARDALRAWAARLKEEVDFSASGDSFSRNQKVKNLLELAAQYDGKARTEEAAFGAGEIGTVRQVRRDSLNVRGERALRRRRRRFG